MAKSRQLPAGTAGPPPVTVTVKAKTGAATALCDYTRVKRLRQCEPKIEGLTPL